MAFCKYHYYFVLLLLNTYRVHQESRDDSQHIQFGATPLFPIFRFQASGGLVLNASYKFSTTHAYY